MKTIGYKKYHILWQQLGSEPFALHQYDYSFNLWLYSMWQLRYRHLLSRQRRTYHCDEFRMISVFGFQDSFRARLLRHKQLHVPQN